MANTTSDPLPSLSEFLERNKANFDLAVRAKMVTLASWPEQEAFLREEWHLMSAMDVEQRANYLKSRHERDKLHWKSVLDSINQLIEVNRARQEKRQNGG